MPRDRFLTIMHYLHLVDSSLQKKTGEVGYDTLSKYALSWTIWLLYFQGITNLCEKYQSMK